MISNPTVTQSMVTWEEQRRNDWTGKCSGAPGCTQVLTDHNQELIADIIVKVIVVAFLLSMLK